MTADVPRVRVARQLPRGEDELPAELLGSTRIFPRQGVRQRHAGHAARQVALVQRAALGEVAFQFRPQGARQHDDAVLGALAVAHDDLPALRIEVVDAELTALLSPQTRPVEQASHEAKDALRPFDGVEDAADFLGGQNDRQKFRPAGADGVEPAQFQSENLRVQKHEGIDRLSGKPPDMASDAEKRWEFRG